MDEPLRKTVSLQSYCAAIYEGLEEWLRQEQAKPGKEHPFVALDGAALAVLRAAVTSIRERARTLSVVCVRIENTEIGLVHIRSPAKVRNRLQSRIGDKLEMPRYVEVPTADGPLWVRPFYEASNSKEFRILPRVQYWEDDYMWLGAVTTEPPVQMMEIGFEPQFPPGYIDALATRGRALYQAAKPVAAIAERVRVLFEDLGIRVKDALRRSAGARTLTKIEVVRMGRVEIVEVGRYAVAGGGAVAVFDEVPVEPAGELQAVGFTGDAIRRWLADMQAFYEEGAREGAANLLDILDGSRATDKEMAEQRAVLDRAIEASRRASRAAAEYLRGVGLITDPDRWIEARASEIVYALDDRNGYRYDAQVRRRLGKEPPAPPSIVQRNLEKIARRDLPADDTKPEHVIVRSAQEVIGLYAELPLFVPPLDIWFDNAMSMIVLADRAVHDARVGVGHRTNSQAE